jgi:hypothetical protein
MQSNRGVWASHRVLGRRILQWGEGNAQKKCPPRKKLQGNMLKKYVQRAVKENIGNKNMRQSLR